MLIDPGSELTFISEQLTSRLRLTRQRSSISILGVCDTQAGQTRGVVACQLQSIHSPEVLSLNAYVLSKLRTTVPSFSSSPRSWPHLQNLQLADPEFLTPSSIDLIIGADSYGLIIKPGLVKDSVSAPIAQHTVFGWIVLGRICNSTVSATSVHHVTIDRDLNQLQELLTQFWVQEEVPSSAIRPLSPEEAECEAHFESTHSRNASGRYIVRLPLKSSVSRLGDSYIIAQRCLQRLLRKLSANETYHNLYSTFLQEYEDLNHMIRVPSSPVSSPVYYLPHHGVLRDDRINSKLRVVFNGSSITTSGSSLNDILHTGAKTQQDILDVLLWVRRHRYIFATDITKMFRQILVHQDDWDLQRILWIDEKRNIVPYRLTTVTYGTRPAPFLAMRVLLQLVEDEGSRFPQAVAPLIKGRYVDDIYGGADHLNGLIEQAQQLIGICSSAGFPLAKWQSNHRGFFSFISVDSSSAQSHSFEECQTKILGLTWLARSDQFRFMVTSPQSGSIITKRIILSEIAQLFDPLGLLSPVIVRAKMLLQELWLEKISWDESVSTQIARRWIQFRDELAELPRISIPRWIHLTSLADIEIHGFSDASQLAMAAAVYVKVITGGKDSTVTLVCAKTKVAPLKRLTIPRLELTAALLLAKLTHHVQKTLDLTHSPVYLWTDSSVTLTWLKGHPSRWKDFIRNRVSAAQELIPQALWRFISGKENPADCASRGLTTEQLEHHQLWWKGPQWLNKSSDHWPPQQFGVTSSAELEERPGHVFTATTDHYVQIWDLIYRYSSLLRLLRITSICFRVLAVLKKRPRSTLTYHLTPGDLEISRLFWVKIIQSEYFKAELRILLQGQHLQKAHPLTRLTAFVDNQGIIRVGGRLKHSHLDNECKHPAIIPRDSPLTQLLIQDAHHRSLHGGTQLTLALLRKNYWIIGGRAPIRSLILRCITCARQRGARAQQLMGQLPLSRVTPSRPFLTTGVDYAGPATLKTWRGRGAKCQKGWLCIFVCFSTSALHLEAVTDYSTNGFLAAFRRFTGRRGICNSLHSDCGTNFVGADAELKRLFKVGSKEAAHLAHLLTNDGTT